MFVANIGNHLGAARVNENPLSDTGYVLELQLQLELPITNMQIGFLVVFQIFTTLCFFLQVSYKLLWSLASLQMIVVVVFLLKMLKKKVVANCLKY